MGGGHQHGHDVGERLYLHKHTVVHDLPAHVKLVSTLLFVLVVVLTPITMYPVFGLYLLMLVALSSLSQLSLRTVAARTAIEFPFVLFAFLLPFVVQGPRVHVLGLELSRLGLEQSFGVLAKGTLGVIATVILAATTQASDLIRALERLKVPATLVQIATFMLRYANVVTDEMRRMKVARESRGFTATGPKSWAVLGQSAGALFIRSYERGERVHLAMLSRGFDGTFYKTDNHTVGLKSWSQALLLPAIALIFLLVSLIVRGL